jgi:hypothetical protein
MELTGRDVTVLAINRSWGRVVSSYNDGWAANCPMGRATAVPEATAAHEPHDVETHNGTVPMVNASDRDEGHAT